MLFWLVCAWLPASCVPFSLCVGYASSMPASCRKLHQGTWLGLLLSECVSVNRFPGKSHFRRNKKQQQSWGWCNRDYRTCVQNIQINSRHCISDSMTSGVSIHCWLDSSSYKKARSRPWSQLYVSEKHYTGVENGPKGHLKCCFFCSS